MLGRRVTELRVQKMYTLRSLSEYLGISMRDLLDIENGKIHPCEDLKRKLCAVLGCDESYFEGGGKLVEYMGT